MSWHKSGRGEDILHWISSMEVEKYVYTAGIGGERFSRELRENGRIVGGKCRNCGEVYVPPQGFCIKCYSPIEEYVDLGTEGFIKSYTIVRVGMDDKPLPEPVIVAFIGFRGARGGLIHLVKGVKPEELKIGQSVEAVLKPKEEREGNIFDILYFKVKGE